MSIKIEKRSVTGEVRAAADFSLEGYAAIFNSPSHDLGGFIESIAPGAFDRCLNSGTDVKALVNHDPSQLLGRTGNGTLKLSTDAHGLKFKVALNKDSQAHRDVYASVQRGDYADCSFCFTVAPNGDVWSTNGTQRTLTDVDLLDVSPAVTYPAYPGTSTSARSANYSTATVEQQRARLAAIDKDYELRHRATVLGAVIIADVFKTEQRGNQNFMSMRCTDALRQLSPPLEYCGHTENHVVGHDLNNDDESCCLRFAYDIDANGDLSLNQDSCEECSYALPPNVLELKRQRQSERSLRLRMRREAGITQ